MARYARIYSEKNKTFFINWQKVKASTKEGRKLRRETEKTEYEVSKNKIKKW